MLRFCSSNKPNNIEVEDDERMVESQPSEEGDYISNIIVSEVPFHFSAEDEQDATIVEDATAKESWLEGPTKLFISLLAQLKPNLGKTYDLKNKNKMWEQIQKSMADEGYNFSVKQVQTKYRTMERKYRGTKIQKTKTGRTRKFCPYERDLEKVFGEQRGACPDFALDSDDCETPPQTINHPPTNPEKRKRLSDANYDKVLQKLDEISKQKADFHASLLQRLENKEKIEQERNELLKHIAESLDNNFSLFLEAQNFSREK